MHDCWHITVRYLILMESRYRGSPGRGRKENFWRIKKKNPKGHIEYWKSKNLNFFSSFSYWTSVCISVSSKLPLFSILSKLKSKSPYRKWDGKRMNFQCNNTYKLRANYPSEKTKLIFSISSILYSRQTAVKKYWI